MKSKNWLNKKPKPINFKLLCVYKHEHINTICHYTRSKHTKLNTNQSLLIELLLQVDSIQTRSNELDSNRVLDMILILEFSNLNT